MKVWGVDTLKKDYEEDLKKSYSTPIKPTYQEWLEVELVNARRCRFREERKNKALYDENQELKSNIKQLKKDLLERESFAEKSRKQTSDYNHI